MSGHQNFPFDFAVLSQDSESNARLGAITTPHGAIDTPNFVFCATKAAIKGVPVSELVTEQVDMILANTYHLMLRPGPDLIKAHGGLHRFMGWDGPMLTDSGGFQIFSLGHGSVADEIKGRNHNWQTKTLLNVSEDGAVFKSYIDGSKKLLTPELSIQIQKKIGADFVVVLDECTPYHVSRQFTEQSMHLSHRWAERCIKEFVNNESYFPQALVGIVQGGVHAELRKISAEFVSGQPFFGHAIGGSLGATKQQMYDVVATGASYLAKEKPIHLLGIGGIDDIWNNVAAGIDTFDCVSPTRVARHGWAYIRNHPNWRINLKNSNFANDFAPIDSECDCGTCQTYSRAYLHYLIKAKEYNAINLVARHNIRFMTRMFQAIRKSIAENRFNQTKSEWLCQ